MTILPVTFNNFHTPSVLQNIKPQVNDPCIMVKEFCKTFKLPNEKRNYSDFDENLATKISSYKEKAITPVLNMLSKTDEEKEITAGLLLLNRIIDAGAKNVGDTYPIISRFNYSSSHNVQVMLAGIYRKTLVPDAFGPLLTVFARNAKNPVQIPFDPNEEVGGAILEYLRNTSAKENYKNTTKTT